VANSNEQSTTPALRILNLGLKTLSKPFIASARNSIVLSLFGATSSVALAEYWGSPLKRSVETKNVALCSSNIRITIHAGEPGASVPGVKRRIEEAWWADHAGATEVGA
jgi:phenylacetate-CoA ligase